MDGATIACLSRRVLLDQSGPCLCEHPSFHAASLLHLRHRPRDASTMRQSWTFALHAAVLICIYSCYGLLQEKILKGVHGE